MKDLYHMSNCWDYFDQFYCISLVRRKDRRDNAEAEFANVGLGRRVAYHLVQAHPQNSEQGIYESHMDCIRKGLLAGARRTVIFEDDVVFNGFDPVRMGQCIDFLKTIDHWEILFLGCLVSRSRPTPNPAVLRVKYRSLAHAYVVNRPFAEALVKKQWSGRPFDAILQDSAKRAYALYPSVAFQNNAQSDNDRHKGLDKFRRLCGGLERIQKANERFQRHRKAIIFLHLLAVLGIIGWLIEPLWH